MSVNTVFMTFTRQLCHHEKPEMLLQGRGWGGTLRTVSPNFTASHLLKAAKARRAAVFQRPQSFHVGARPYFPRMGLVFRALLFPVMHLSLRTWRRVFWG